MQTVARFKVRKTLKGEVISEEILEEFPEQLPAMLKELGIIYAENFSQNPRFQAFCENFRIDAGQVDCKQMNGIQPQQLPEDQYAMRLE